MKPIVFRTANAMYSGSLTDMASAIGDIVAQRCHVMLYDEMAEPNGRMDAIRTVWRPSEEERQAIAAGADIEMVVLGTICPSVSLKTTADRERTVCEDEYDDPFNRS